MLYYVYIEYIITYKIKVIQKPILKNLIKTRMHHA